ncbi:MAG: hypothetical protein ED556_13480 [Winogradskyella sp.]|nr:MAG: hypothetical protein ED556_13480 [Winogradskyella sp.]
MSLALCTSIYAQRIVDESVSFYDIIKPLQPLDASVKTYKVVLNIPYTLTVEDVKAQSLKDFEAEKANHDNVIAQSKADYEEKLANYDIEVKQAKENYETEMKDFKELSLLERLALTEQGKKPKLKTPARPTYVEPAEPIYQEPRLADYLIFDKEALAHNMALNGYEKGEDVIFIIDMSKMEFQENGGQTFYKQPTKLTVLVNGETISEELFGDKSKFLTSSSSNTINLNRYEKDNVNKTLKSIEKHINENYGYTPVSKKITIEFPKNKKREYDDLEQAKIKAISAFRKMTKEAPKERREAAMSDIDNVKDIWVSTLDKVNYSDKKATYNANIAKSIFFNLLSVQTTLGLKDDAEETLELLQEKRIDLDFNYTEKQRITKLEDLVYKL